MRITTFQLVTLALGFTEMTVDGGADEVVAALTDAAKSFTTTFPEARWSAITTQSQPWSLTGVAAFPDGDFTQLSFAASTPDARVLDIALQQIDSLGGASSAWASVSRESTYAAWLERGSCTFEDNRLGRPCHPPSCAIKTRGIEWGSRTGRPGDRVLEGQLSGPRKVRAPQGKVVANSHPG